jgi:ribose transport system ATP-binding protein
MDAPAVRMRGISKSFNRVRVLDAVDFELARGEIHALVGGNGAGKSTLMKILVGVYTSDDGTYEVDGGEVRFHSIHDAIAARVGMVFQEFSLVPQLTVAQNIFLAREARGRAGLIDDGEMVARARAIFETMKVEIDPRRTLQDLPTAYWQLTEIAKALSQDARVLIMDEPTAALAKTETQDLFALMRRLREQGISIIYISHRMEEVFEVCDRVTVLRDGRIAMTRDTSDVTMAEIIRAIVGQQLEHSMDWEERTVGDEVVLEARGITAGDRLQDVDLQLRKGEVLGLAGLMGSGRTELARALFGIDPIDGGEILLDGRPIGIRGPRVAIDGGLALIPEDRRVQGLVLGHTVRENILLPLLGRLSRAGFVDDGEGDRRARESVETLAIKTRSIRQPIRELSGGNQQKVVIAKWLAMKPRILIMDEPTAGVDIGTKAEIVAMIRAFADAGGSVIMISSELPELLAVSDRLLVMRDGRVDSEIDRRTIRREEDLHHAVQGLQA